jgi:predicted lipoprotein with Yx(FWY)xxD motif
MLSRQGATRRVSLALLCAGTLGLAAGCSSTSPSSAGEAAKGSGQAVKVDVRSVPGVGQVLVTGKGYVLYVFEPDHHRTVTCTGACAGTWPPLMESSGADLVGGPGVQQALFGADPDPVGGRVVTYAGWPLYGYTGDLQPGQATGQDIDTNGGKWYVIRPSGQLVETEP